MLNKPLKHDDIDSLINNTLNEDIQGGDITTENTILAGQICEAELIAKDPLVLSGLEIFKALFKKLDSGTVFLSEPFHDGDSVPKGSIIVKFRSECRKLLEGERSGLNILQWLSGIATLTQKYVAKAHPLTVLDTRKTTPGLRIFEKYAVSCGGGSNHRFGLYDAVMIKDNHIKASGGISQAIRRIRKAIGKENKIEVETKNLNEVREALEQTVDIIMLDNMSMDSIYESVKLIDGKAKVEISGGVDLKSLDEISKSGADFVSIGALTHSAPAVDISMDIINSFDEK